MRYRHIKGAKRVLVPFLARGIASACLTLFVSAHPNTTAQAQKASERETAPPAAGNLKTGARHAGLDAEASDIDALIIEVARNGRAMHRRMFEYTWTSKHTTRETNKRGELTKQTVEIYETYPVRGEFVKKLVSKNGAPLSAEQAGREFRRVVRNLERAERQEKEKYESAVAPAQTTTVKEDATAIPAYGPTSAFHGYGGGDISFSISRFLRAATFHSPRPARRDGRDTIILDFRPRTDFHPAESIEMPYAKLSGRIWIDALDKVVVRLEAWPDASPASKDGDGGDASHAEPSIVFQQARQPNGTWLESLVRIKTTANRDIFNRVNLDYTKEVGDFRRFDTNAGEVKIEVTSDK